jgi:hypothetical protein
MRTATSKKSPGRGLDVLLRALWTALSSHGEMQLGGMLE